MWHSSQRVFRRTLEERPSGAGGLSVGCCYFALFLASVALIVVVFIYALTSFVFSVQTDEGDHRGEGEGCNL